MIKCKTDFKGCCSNINGERVAWFSCKNQRYESDTSLLTEKLKDKIKINVNVGDINGDL